MKKIVRHISLDFSRETGVRASFATQLDFNSREFIITLYDDGVEFPLPQGVLVAMNIRRADGTSGAIVCDVLEDGRVRYNVGPWALSIPGETFFSVSVYDGEHGKLTSESFVVDIEPLLCEGEDIKEDSEDYTLFVQMINALANISVAESQRSDAEEMRKANEEIRNKNEKNRIQGENKRNEIAQKAIDALDGLIAIQNRFINQDISISTTLKVLDVYPVGSIYTSVNSLNPAVLFGGTWERLKDRFLLGAGDKYSLGESGGSADAVLLQHTHGILTESGNPIFLKSGTDSSGWLLKGADPEYVTNGADSSWKVYGGYQGIGENGDGKNMPPYLTVYMWRRVA